MVVITRFGAAYQVKKMLETRWAGPMFPGGFVLLTDNSYYKEREDEYDLIPDEELNRSKESEVCYIVKITRLVYLPLSNCFYFLSHNTL